MSNNTYKNSKNILIMGDSQFTQTRHLDEHFAGQQSRANQHTLPKWENHRIYHGTHGTTACSRTIKQIYIYILLPFNQSQVGGTEGCSQIMISSLSFHLSVHRHKYIYIYNKFFQRASFGLMTDLWSSTGRNIFMGSQGGQPIQQRPMGSQPRTPGCPTLQAEALLRGFPELCRAKLLL